MNRVINDGLFLFHCGGWCWPWRLAGQSGLHKWGLRSVESVINTNTSHHSTTLI